MRSAAALARRAAVVAALPLCAASCAANAAGPADADRLEAARARWARRGPAAYTVTIHRSCECLPEMSGPVVVTVRDGAVTARRYARTGATPAPQYAPAFPGVEGLFALVDAGVRDASTRPREVRYDAALGYPTRIVLGDPATDAPVYTVSGLRPE
jgi:hypothetical protein